MSMRCVHTRLFPRLRAFLCCVPAFSLNSGLIVLGSGNGVMGPAHDQERACRGTRYPLGHGMEYL
jgi:hypothetical protein